MRRTQRKLDPQQTRKLGQARPIPDPGGHNDEVVWQADPVARENIRAGMARYAEDERVVGAVKLFLRMDELEPMLRRVPVTNDIEFHTMEAWLGVDVLWQEGELAELYGPAPTVEQVKMSLQLLAAKEEQEP